jgi:hypothetical protein
MITLFRTEQYSEKADNIELRGLSTDTKPTEWSGKPIGNGSSFFELDTQTVFFFDADSQTWK